MKWGKSEVSLNKIWYGDRFLIETRLYNEYLDTFCNNMDVMATHYDVMDIPDMFCNK